MNVLFCPIFSMRSYKTGKYSILKDGNFQLTMSRVLASDFDTIMVTVPNDASDFQETLERFKANKNVYFVKAKYGENAAQTRTTFWEQNEHFETMFVDVLITDITGYPGKIPVIYNFNITKLPELNRPYIDEVFDKDLDSIQQSLFTTVLNPRQREYILECRPDLANKVQVYLKCANETLLPTGETPLYMLDSMTIFWPFRISDKAYKWVEFIQAFEEQNLQEHGWQIMITDPNQSSQNLPKYVTVLEPTKEQYYRILEGRPIVVMLDEIDTVLHPGTIELMYYGCKVITLPSSLIPHENQITDLSELTTKLTNVSSDKIDVSRFVYDGLETSTRYNIGNLEHFLKANR